jgi:acetyl esterase
MPSDLSTPSPQPHLDPRLQAFFSAMPAFELPPFASLDAATMRAIFDNAMAAGEPVPAHTEELSVTGAGAQLPARLYRPLQGDIEAVIVYFHGGGFVFGTLETHDQTCRLLCQETRALVISVAYRLAPEFQFPIPLQDCHQATRWAAQQRAHWGAAELPLFVAGDSAGGNLAAAVCLKARDSDLRIAGQLLFYPVTNHDFNTASYRNGDNTPILTTAMMRRFWELYLQKAEDGADPLASPLRCATLTQLPPAYVLTAELDPLRDEGHAYVAALRAAGVPTRHRDCAGMVHGFLGIPAVEDSARAIYAEVAAFMREPHR